MSEPLIKNQCIGLKTVYHTPHICGKCLEHIGEDWNYCPECGTPTGLSVQDYKETQELLNNRSENDGKINRTRTLLVR
jgi:predicted amidophosphoribosyltransferase